MRTLQITAALCVAATIELHAQSTTLDAQASDPVVLGWMIGAPPPPDKTISYSSGQFFHFPESRWSFSNIRQFVPTKTIARGDTPIAPLERALRTDLDAITFTPIGKTEAMTWAQSLHANYTDGILILHRGRIVYERYFGVLQPHIPHIAFSVTKSYIGTIAAMLIAEGNLDEKATVASYIPELKNSGYSSATVRDLLDMTVGLDYSENYEDPRSQVNEYKRAGNFLERPSGYQGPNTYRAFLASLKQARPHGEQFKYMTVNTDALAWVLHRVTGKSLTEQMRERFWTNLGLEQDGFFSVDTAGTEWCSGGLNLTLRDMARFGEMMRLDGRFAGRQIVPKPIIEDIRRGADRGRFARAGYKTLPGASYRNMWWIHHNSHGAYSARGIHGQAVYIDPKAEMVIVRLASHPLGSNSNYDATSLPAYQAIAERLLAKPR
jgi:CubicO group peptidase (beta-lactamase class C family)